MGKIILPTKHELGEIKLIRKYDFGKNEPAIFLLGPIFDAPLWQDEATRILLSINSDLTIFNPRRSVAEDLQHLVVDEGNPMFHRQRAWELDYIDLISQGKNKAAMFWLPNREKITPGVIYAGTTRVEFGTMIMKAKYEPQKTNFAIGAQKEFPNLSIMLEDLQTYAPRTVHETLEETCEEAVRLARQSI